MRKIWIAKNTNPMNEIYAFAQRSYFYVDINIPYGVDINFEDFVKNLGFNVQVFFRREYNNVRYFFPCSNPKEVEAIFQIVAKFLENQAEIAEIVETVDPNPTTYNASKLISEATGAGDGL